MKTRYGFGSDMSGAAAAGRVAAHLVVAACILGAGGGCSSTAKLPPPPPRHVYAATPAPVEGSANSLWRDSAGLFEDLRARRVNDLLTILLAENFSGSGEADTNATRKSTLDAKVTGFFGAPLNLNRPNLYGGGNAFSPTVSGSMENDFEGKGQTNRAGKITGTLTARVVETMPNGNLVLESRKEITINHEKQILVLRGMIRQEDVDANNTVPSSKVADAEIFLVGDGVVQDKQRPGWLVRILEGIWPF